jgi:hypothetical protein
MPQASDACFPHVTPDEVRLLGLAQPFMVYLPRQQLKM